MNFTGFNLMIWPGLLLMIAQLALGVFAYVGVRRKLRSRVVVGGMSGDLAQLAAQLLPDFPGVEAAVVGGKGQMPAGFAPGKVFLVRSQLTRLDLTAIYILALSLVNASLMPKSAWNVLRYLPHLFGLELVLFCLAAAFGGLFSLAFCLLTLGLFAGSNYYYYQFQDLGERAGGLLVERLNLPEDLWAELQALVQAFYWQIFAYPVSFFRNVLGFIIP